MSAKRSLVVLAMTAASLTAGCDKVPLMSPGGSQILFEANPSFVVANGGRSMLTAVLTEPAGTFVPDGTVVFFFSTLGQVDASGKTVNGIARVYFVADSRSGHACVTAYSGGAAPSAATCTTSGGGTAASPAPSTGGSGRATGQGSATIQIDIGSALPARAFLSADPPRITNPRRTTIIATVFDASGNPVQNVPVVFTITAATPVLEETLDSGGSPAFTDSNGQAFDTLRTRALPVPPQKTVTVSAAVPALTGTAPSVTVFVN